MEQMIKEQWEQILPFTLTELKTLKFTQAVLTQLELDLSLETSELKVAQAEMAETFVIFKRYTILFKRLLEISKSLFLYFIFEIKKAIGNPMAF